MDKNSIMSRLGALLHERFDVDPAAVAPDTRLSELGIDSMLSADMMLDIEDALGFTFKSMDLPRDPTLQDVVELVHANLEQAGA